MKLQRSNRENFLESLKKFDLYPKKHMVFNITVKTELNVKKKKSNILCEYFIRKPIWLYKYQKGRFYVKNTTGNIVGHAS